MTLTAPERLDLAQESRLLVVNADDFGRSPGINRGVLEAYEHGILTSASLMTHWPASAEAAQAALNRPGLGVGLHVDLAEWIYVDGEWEATYLRVDPRDRDAVAAEVQRQLQAFRRLLDRDPTHLDSHQHVHRDEPARSILLELAAELDVPLRHYAERVRYCGAFFGQTNHGESLREAIEVEGLVRTLAGLPEGVTELACHPGYATDLATAYRRDREVEVRTLCDPAVRFALDELGIVPCSFAELAAG